MGCTGSKSAGGDLPPFAKDLQKVIAFDNVEADPYKPEAGTVVYEENLTIVEKFAPFLVKHPEIGVILESHTACPSDGRCNSKCNRLSDTNAQNLIGDFLSVGCKNNFQTRCWGCQHPSIKRTNLITVTLLDDPDKHIPILVVEDPNGLSHPTGGVGDSDINKRRAAELSALEEALRKRDRDLTQREEELNRQVVEQLSREIEDALREDIEFVKNEAALSEEGQRICEKVIPYLRRMPQISIHVDSHTNCAAGHCDNECKLQELSQLRVDNVVSFFRSHGCQNQFIPRGWGCKHPEIHNVRLVRIYPNRANHENIVNYISVKAR